MATFVTNTPLPRDASTPAVSCAAHTLDGEQRQELALQVLARSEPVTELSVRHQVSRKFLYQQADKGEQALAQAFQSPPSGEEEVLFYTLHGQRLSFFEGLKVECQQRAQCRFVRRLGSR